MKEVTLTLLHLKLELTDVVLLYLHLLSNFDQGRLWVFFQAQSTVDVDFLLAMLAFALWVGKLDLDVDRAAFDRQETYVNIASFEYLSRLVLCVDEEDVFREV